ncbi:MAG: right-handed parallel beta-helix repeat-containing protein [Clostridia bacterium]|nr:right-handed parallel beta-helix repeat-containing protein [Clostridia bacterium]
MSDICGITTIYVTKNFIGFKDGASGKVVGSLEEAVKACAELRQSGNYQPLTVKIASGEYVLSRELIFTPELFSVCFEALSGNADDVIISGAERRSGEKSVFCGKNCLSVPLPKGVSDLFIGTKRAYPTRFPENGFLDFAGAENEGTMLDDVSKWVKLHPKDVKDLSEEDVENATLNFLHYWVDEHTAVESYDKKTGKLVMKEYSRYGIYGEKTKAVYYLTNVKKAFGQKGRWYSDKKAGKAYYIPADGESADEAFYVPHLHRLIGIKGTPENKVKNLKFKNLTFAYTRGDRQIFRDDGLSVASDGQAAASAGGAFEIEYAENCSITGCKFEHYGLYGICIFEGSSNIRISKSTFTDGGAGGIKVSGADIYGKEEARTHSIKISDCEITGCGKRYMAACGILIGHAYDNQITHNEIHDLYYSGISVGWVWGYKESVTKNNYIAHNKIYDIGKGVLSDMGGVYLLGEQQGTKVYNNLIYNVKAREYGGWAIYTDEGCSYVTVENNVCYDCSENCFHQHYGKMNVVKNNLFARAGAELCRITRGEMHLSAVFENNAFMADGSAVYGLPDEEYVKRGTVQTRNNAICGKSGKDIIMISGDKKYSFSEAQALGLENGSVLAAAKFEIFYDGKAEVSGDGILKSGYVPIDLKSVGIRK